MKLIQIIKTAAMAALFLTGSKSSKTTPEANACQLNDDYFNPCESLGFELIAGTPTKSTTRWLIGEDHTHHDLSIQCVEAIAKLPGKKALYVEGTTKKPFPQNECKIIYPINLKKLNISCFGWDIPTDEKDFYGNDIQTRYYRDLMSILNTYRQNPASDEQWDAQWQLFASGQKTLPNEEDPEWIKTLAKMILQERAQGLTYKDIFDFNKRKPVAYPKGEKYTKHLLDRDKAIVDTLRKHPKDKTAILVAGSFHFNSGNFYDKSFPEAKNLVQRAMKKDSKDSSYAILKYR